jgi:hypothetical protein
LLHSMAAGRDGCVHRGHPAEESSLELTLDGFPLFIWHSRQRFPKPLVDAFSFAHCGAAARLVSACGTDGAPGPHLFRGDGHWRIAAWT